MKAYALLILLLLCPACASHKHARDTSVREASVLTQKQTSEEKINLEKQYLEIGKKETNTQYRERTRIISYDPESGNISTVQETWREFGRNELDDSTRQGSDVSRIEKKDSINTHSQTTTKLDEHLESKSDSRLVQGIEWLWILLPISVITTIIYYIKNGRKKKHNK